MARCLRLTHIATVALSAVKKLYVILEMRHAEILSLGNKLAVLKVCEAAVNLKFWGRIRLIHVHEDISS